MFDRGDPVPGVIFGLAHFRHPRAFIRPFLVDTEVIDAHDAVAVRSAPQHGAAPG